MAGTPVSAIQPFCTPQQFLVRYDYRPVGQLLKDDGTVESPADIINDPILLTLLKQNSGKLEAAIYKGDRYRPADLLAIINNTANNNQLDLLAGIVADMTLIDLYRRRVNIMMPEIPAVKESLATLEAFKTGDDIFGLQEVMDAGREEEQVEDILDVQRRNDPSWQARRLFGRRAKWENGTVGGAVAWPEA